MEAVTRELEKLFPGQVVYDPDQRTWTVSGHTEDASGIDRLDTAVSEVNPHLKDWFLYRPDSKGNVYHLDPNDKVAGSR